MKLFLCALGILVVTSTALAEEVTRKEGDKSLNFSVIRTELQPYKYGFGGKYWISSDIAYSGSIDISDDEQNTTSTDQSTSKRNSSYYALSIALEKHLQTSSSLLPYIGGELKYSRDKYESDYASVNYTSTYENTGKQYGVGVLAGAEYALNKNISLAGEYAFGFRYSVRKYNDTWGDQTSRSKGFDLSVGRLTLLLYF